MKFTSPFLRLRIGKFAWSGAGTLFKRIVKAAETVKSAAHGNVDHLLVRIGDLHPDLRNEIGKAFADAFADGTYYHRITQRPKESSEGNMTLGIRTIALSAAEKWKQ